MGAWECDSCRGIGHIWHDRDGRVSSERCRSCNGSGDGWASLLIALSVAAIAVAAYAWFCLGMPGAPQWARPSLGATSQTEPPKVR